MNDNSTHMPSRAMLQALAMVEAFDKAGLVAMPIDPTDEMLIAGATTGDIEVETVRRVWRAMLDAS
ncbi:MAG: hypothetical protein U9N14_00090 [Pseudomonadota bacterium]|nr:hypothetical protein [Pseudomonadota bacterium]